MNTNGEILNLVNPHSLVRKTFSTPLHLSQGGIVETTVPNRFSRKSFVPKNGLDLIKLSSSISEDLKNLGASEAFVRKTSPGVCEAIKNAYEHGNKMDREIPILFAQCFGNEVEFLVGDRGDELNPNFLPYILLFRQKEQRENYLTLPDFYSFSGGLFAPLGHSGAGTKTINFCFGGNVNYYKRKGGGLLVHLHKPFDN